MKRVYKRKIIYCGFYLLMAYSRLKLVIELIISSLETLQVLLEFLIEYKDILYAQFLVN